MKNVHKIVWLSCEFYIPGRYCASPLRNM